MVGIMEFSLKLPSGELHELDDDKSSLVQVMGWCHQTITRTNDDPVH